MKNYLLVFGICLMIIGALMLAFSKNKEKVKLAGLILLFIGFIFFVPNLF